MKIFHLKEHFKQFKTASYIDDSFCGILTEDSEGYHFSYDGNYLKSAGRKVERA